MSKRQWRWLGNNMRYQSDSKQSICHWLAGRRQRTRNWYKSMSVQPLQPVLNPPPRWKQTTQAKVDQRPLQILTTFSILIRRHDNPFQAKWNITFTTGGGGGMQASFNYFVN